MPEKSSPFLHLNAAPPNRRQRLSRRLGVLVGVVLLAILAAAVVFRLSGGSLEGVVDGQWTEVGAPVTAQVLDIRVKQDQLVSAGETLLLLDVSEREAGSNRESQARLEALKEQLRLAEKAEDEARDALKQASQAHARAQVALRQTPVPDPQDTASRQAYARMQSTEVAARAGLENARNRLETASSARYVAGNAYSQLRDSLGLRRTTRSRALPPITVAAPMDGKVRLPALQPGDTVAQGQGLAIIDPVLPEHLWVTVQVRPDRLQRFGAGQEFRLRFPDHQDLELTGVLLQVNDPADSGDVAVVIGFRDYDPLTMPGLGIGQPVSVREK